MGVPVSPLGSHLLSSVSNLLIFLPKDINKCPEDIWGVFGKPKNEKNEIPFLLLDVFRCLQTTREMENKHRYSTSAIQISVIFFFFSNPGMENHVSPSILGAIEFMEHWKTEIQWKF